MNRLVPALATIAAAAAFAACSAGASDAPAPVPTAAPSPTAPVQAQRGVDCATVWQVGATLPSNYTGCTSGKGPGQQVATDCRDGRTLVVYSDQLIALTGGTIAQPAAPLRNSRTYLDLHGACTGL